MTLMPQRWTTFFTMPVGRVAVIALLIALASGEMAYGQGDIRRCETPFAGLALCGL
jgi:hypothetical protein